MAPFKIPQNASEDEIRVLFFHDVLSTSTVHLSKLPVTFSEPVWKWTDLNGLLEILLVDFQGWEAGGGGHSWDRGGGLQLPPDDLCQVLL